LSPISGNPLLSPKTIGIVVRKSRSTIDTDEVACEPVLVIFGDEFWVRTGLACPSNPQGSGIFYLHVAILATSGEKTFRYFVE
jgi:hypothetical protein